MAEKHPDPVDVAIGARVRERRLRIGLSQTALAQRLGISFQQLQKYETGANRISGSMIDRACKALAVDANYLFSADVIETDGPIGRAHIELVKLFEAMDPARQKSLLNVARAMMPDDLAAA